MNKATLKQNTQVALAKLAGIVQVFPKINLRIEGYTDSTGSDELNSACRGNAPSPYSDSFRSRAWPRAA